ncbi:MAG: hypothetical protein AB7T49_00335 [Oligoflexales bacterium]
MEQKEAETKQHTKGDKDYLLSKHANQLIRESGISPEILEKANIFSIDDDKARKSSLAPGGGIVFPYLTLDGQASGYRVRLDSPIVREDGTRQRYHQPKDSSLTCYFLPDAIDLIKSAGIPLIIVEGEKKLHCIESISHLDGIAKVAYPGCWNVKKKGHKGLGSPWDAIPFNMRTVSLVVDTNYFTNPNATAAGDFLLKELFNGGAKVSLVDLRSAYSDGKCPKEVKPDDLVTDLGAEALLECLKKPVWTFYKNNRFLKSMPKTEDEILALLRSLILLPKLEIDAIINEIRAKGQFRIEPLRDLFEKAALEWNDLRPNRRMPKGVVHTIDISDSIPKAQVLSNIADRLLEIGSCYRFGSDLVYVDDGERDIIEPSMLPARLTDFGIEAVKKKKDGLGYAFLPESHAKGFFYSKRTMVRFKEIALFTDVPTYDRNWRLIKPGYDADEKIFYTGREIIPVQSHKEIGAVVNSMLFKDQASKANFVATMLTSILRNRYRGNRPFVPTTGNRPQIGKSYAVKIISLIAEGMLPKSISFHVNQEEFEKQIGAIIRSRDILLIDNVKSARPIDSPVLERLVTDDPMSFRLLGRSENISRPNTVLVMVTMNDAQFSRDLITRSLPVEFFLDESVDPSAYRFGNDLILEHVAANRFRILQELCGMVELWKAKGFPHYEGPFRFREWAKEVGGIVVANGFNEFLQNLESASAGYDKASREVGEMFSSVLNKNMTANALIKLCCDEDLFADVRTSVRPPTVLSALLRRYVGKTLPLPDGRRFRIAEDYDPGQKVKIYRAEAIEVRSVMGLSTGTAGTTGDLDMLSPRVVTVRNETDKEAPPGIPGTETGPASETETAGLGDDETIWPQNPRTVPGIPGTNRKLLSQKGESSRVPTKSVTPSVPALPPVSPEFNEPQSTDVNGLEW